MERVWAYSVLPQVLLHQSLGGLGSLEFLLQPLVALLLKALA
jgi:hypothetical protein